MLTTSASEMFPLVTPEMFRRRARRHLLNMTAGAAQNDTLVFSRSATLTLSQPNLQFCIAKGFDRASKIENHIQGRGLG